MFVYAGLCVGRAATQFFYYENHGGDSTTFIQYLQAFLRL
ncbi:hypothetical protein EDC30_105189 [Paucimonas lemoignei]|uniref:Uncharacterized protein n=1 Tax=Paucimonas lemoignei TaxID=29443 RepID=A0A4R3HUQ9_PAULE|nr:hypothetical protein EDC30_105189 [Paucimonas lemoignei]